MLHTLDTITETEALGEIMKMHSVGNASGHTRIEVAHGDKAELAERIGKLPPTTVDMIRSGLQLLFDRV